MLTVCALSTPEQKPSCTKRFMPRRSDSALIASSTSRTARANESALSRRGALSPMPERSKRSIA